jgi:hypothetical protein
VTERSPLATAKTARARLRDDARGRDGGVRKELAKESTK